MTAINRIGKGLPTLKQLRQDQVVFNQFKNDCWQKARSIFPFADLAPPLVYLDKNIAQTKMGKELAFINFADHFVSINLALLIELAGSTRFLRVIMAHERGHACYVPQNLASYAHLLNAAHQGCKNWETAKLFVNIFGDIIINLLIHHWDRQNNEGDGVKELFGALTQSKRSSNEIDSFWRVYMGIYDRLMKRGNPILPKEEIMVKESSAAEIISKYLENMTPYLDSWVNHIEEFARIMKDFMPVSEPVMIDIIEKGSYDPPPGGEKRNVSGEIGSNEELESDEGTSRTGKDTRKLPDGLRGLLPKNPLKPEEYKRFQEILEEGLNLPKETSVILAHRELARRNFIKAPESISHAGQLPFSIGTRAWRCGDPVREIDKQELARTPLKLPHNIRKPYHPPSSNFPGQIPKQRPSNLIVLIDSSGSMPDLYQEPSPLVVAGKTVANAVLKKMGYVYVVNYSSRENWVSSETFTQNEDKIDQILCKRIAIGSQTTFPVEGYLEALDRGKQFCLRNRGNLQVLIITDREIKNFISPFTGSYRILDEPSARMVALQGGLRLPYVSGASIFINSAEFDELSIIKQFGFNVNTVSSWQDLYGLSRKKAIELYLTTGDLD